STEYISVLRVTATIEELVEDFHKGPHQSLDTLISIRERLDLFPVISTQQEGSEPNIDLDIKREELGSLKKQLYQRTKILMRLKEEEAKIGFDRKLYIQITDEEEVIEEIQKHIQELEAEIKERERIEEQLPITIGTSEKPKAHSVKRQRDLKILRSIFENIYTPALDMFFRHARMGYVPDNIFFFKYGVEHFVTSSNFLIYDKVLEQRIKDFYSAWSYTLDFGHIFQPSLNSNRFILIEPDENPWLVDDYPKFFEAVELAEQR
ncbi:MAG: hypothetical protein KJZ60_12440, partial [Ignavibacteriaceae bacterium]|nr:hypothetical protein [Ignavibacteriaceae bacterium]